MDKLKVAFSPNNAIWAVKEFRDLIEDIKADDEGTELFLITNEEIGFASLVQSELNIDEDHFFRVNTYEDVVQKLIETKSLIYLSGDFPLNRLINKVNPINLEINNVTGTQAIDVNFTIKDDYRVQPKYLTYLKFWTDQINKYDKKGK